MLWTCVTLNTFGRGSDGNLTTRFRMRPQVVDLTQSTIYNTHMWVFLTLSARAIYLQAMTWSFTMTAAYCPHNKHSLPLPPTLTSTVGVSGGLSSFRSFTFLSFLPGRPSSPLINSLGRKTNHSCLSVLVLPRESKSTSALPHSHLPVVPVALLEQVVVLYLHILALPGRLVIG